MRFFGKRKQPKLEPQSHKHDWTYRRVLNGWICTSCLQRATDKPF